MKLPTEKRIGIIGGGQLGKMLIEASRPWNIEYVVLENDANCPASGVANKIITGSLYDAEKIKELAGQSDVITFEIEHINVDILLQLEAEGHKIIPSPKTLQMIQDKGLQKEFYKSAGLPTAPFVIVEKHEELLNHLNLFSENAVVIKSRTGGYDGKGVQIVNKSDIVNNDFILLTPSVVEKYYENITEFAVIVARDKAGNSTTFPLIEMYFNPVSNLVEFLFSPAEIDAETEQKCREIAVSAIEKMNGTGLFAVELFVTKENEILINEIAPRPHNSGHHTIEGCMTSQFEQLNRILLGLPLGNTSMVMPSAMINLVGPENLFGNYVLKNTENLLKMDGVFIHLYNKKEIKPNRKMGHITILAETVEALKQKADMVFTMIQFVAPE